MIDRCIGKTKLIVLTFTIIAFLTGSSLAGNLKNVVIISIDALHPDTLQRAKIPNLQKLMRTGAYCPDGLFIVVPSSIES